MLERNLGCFRVPLPPPPYSKQRVYSTIVRKFGQSLALTSKVVKTKELNRNYCCSAVASLVYLSVIKDHGQQSAPGVGLARDTNPPPQIDSEYMPWSLARKGVGHSSV